MCGSLLLRVLAPLARLLAPAPRHSYDYDLPILAMDIVIAGGGVTLAVADACPLSPNLSLPSHYLQTMHELQVRAPPSWDDGLWVG